ncbi:MAG: hypothetical protein LLG06_19760 [Desulfobacteraceae bacterium]|nr:hypothetical protein [Desulfobacteraceae bacterium]
MTTKNTFAQKWYQQSATQKEELDTIMELNDGTGRVFAYALAGATDLAVGKVTQTAVATDNAHNEALSSTQSAAIGDTSLTMTFGGAVTASFFKDGYLWVNDATGEGHMYRVKDHPAGTADVKVDLKDPIRVALVASTSEVSLLQNRQALVVIAVAATLTGCPIGVPPIPVTAGYYFWNQVKGPTAVLTAGTVVLGNSVCVLTTDGAVAPKATDSVLCTVGTVLRVNGNTEYSLINLAIPGY